MFLRERRNTLQSLLITGDSSEWKRHRTRVVRDGQANALCAIIYTDIFHPLSITNKKCIVCSIGGVAEWSNAPHLKCGVPQGTVSSNLTSSAKQV